MSSIIFRSISAVFLITLLVTSSAFAQKPVVNITSTNINFDDGIMTIIGENFDIGPNPTEVFLGGIPLNIQSNNGSTIVADLPENLAPGQYQLLVKSGPGQRKMDNETVTVGEQGPQGDQGDQGNQGPQGGQGPAGPQGPQGPQGPPGSQGVQGNPGPAGPPGPKGDQGPAGNDGTDGAPGADGSDGAQGPKGDQGPQGDQGSQGSDGPTGPEGPKGDQGDPGKDGIDGPGFVIERQDINEGECGMGGTGFALLGGPDLDNNGIPDAEIYREVVCDGIPGADGNDGADGAAGNDGEDGLDVTTVCANQEVLLANGTCFDITILFPECPCITPRFIIDIMPQTLGSVECTNEPDGDIQLMGVRSDLTTIFQALVTPSFLGGVSACSFIDQANGIDTTIFNITPAEVIQCRSIILESQMWALNCSE